MMMYLGCDGGEIVVENENEIEVEVGIDNQRGQGQLLVDGQLTLRIP